LCTPGPPQASSLICRRTNSKVQLRVEYTCKCMNMHAHITLSETLALKSTTISARSVAPPIDTHSSPICGLKHSLDAIAVHRRFNSLSDPFIKVIATGSTPARQLRARLIQNLGPEFQERLSSDLQRRQLPTAPGFQRFTSLASSLFLTGD
jgi:hypothetical protein